MGDPYWRYGGGGSGRPSSSERGHIPKSTFPGYLSSEPSTQADYNSYSCMNPRTTPSDFLYKDILPSRTGEYGMNVMSNVRAEPPGASYKGYPSSFEDPNMSIHHRDVASGRTPGIPDVSYDRPNSMTRNDGNPAPDFFHKDILPSHSRAYDVYDMPSVNAEPSVSGLVAGSSYKDYPSSFEDPNLLVHRRDVVSGRTPGIPDVGYDRPNSIIKANGNPAPVVESNVLFVDGLPTDCTRREVGHLFRPFIGFREIRLIHKERRRRGDKALVLCFIEFTDSKCARTAMEALQGYKFDDKKPNSCPLRIHFAHFPFRLPSDHDAPESGGSR